MPVALDSPRYFGAHISENIAVTPEGYRICRGCVIGRSGFQKYAVAELEDPDGLLADYAPTDEIQIWRDPSEVFSPATLSSFEGKTVTLTHPEKLLDSESDREHHVGHVQNIRPGTEPLDSGDLPMLGDILVKDEDGIRALDAGVRELSCGYTYKLFREGNRFDQRNIVGNHLAIVPKGRAGAEARINDADPKGAPVKFTLKALYARGIAAIAKENPDQLAEALDVVREPAPAPLSAIMDAAQSSKLVEIGETADGVKVFKRIAKDADPAPDPAMDQKAKDRKAMHDALDEQFAAADAEEATKATEKDAAVDALKNMFSAKDAAHPDDCDCADCKGTKDADPPAEKKEEKADDGEIVTPTEVLPASERQESQFDSAKVFIKAFRPFVARSTDRRLKAAFDTAVQAVERAASKEKNDNAGDYGSFAAAAHERGNDAARQRSEKSDEIAQAEKVEKAYAGILRPKKASK